MNLNFIKPKTSTEEIEKLKEIAEEAQRLRKVSPNGINSWPDEFKNKIVKELMEGKLSTKEISRVIKIPKTTIFGWKNKIKKERQEINKSFKELKVVEDQERKSTTSKTLKIISKKGYEIFGLDEEVIIKLFKEGLL